MLQESEENMSFEGEQNVSGNDLDLLGQLENLNIIDGDNTEQASKASSKVLLRNNPIFDKSFESTKV